MASRDTTDWLVWFVQAKLQTTAQGSACQGYPAPRMCFSLPPQLHPDHPSDTRILLLRQLLTYGWFSVLSACPTGRTAVPGQQHSPSRNSCSTHCPTHLARIHPGACFKAGLTLISSALRAGPPSVWSSSTAVNLTPTSVSSCLARLAKGQKVQENTTTCILNDTAKCVCMQQHKALNVSSVLYMAVAEQSLSHCLACSCLLVKEGPIDTATCTTRAHVPECCQSLFE